MHISLLGTCRTSTTVAAELRLRGYEGALIKTSHVIHDVNNNFFLENNGTVRLIEKGNTQLGETLDLEYQVDTFMCTSLINMASTALNRELRLEGRTVKRLAKDALQQIIEDIGGDHSI